MGWRADLAAKSTMFCYCRGQELKKLRRVYKSSCKGSDALFWISQVPALTCVVAHRYITYIHNLK